MSDSQQKRNVRVFVGIPVLGNPTYEMMFSTVNYALHKTHPAMISGRRGTYTHSARNKLVWEAAKEKATHIMFIDGDTRFPADGVQQLLDHDKDIVGGVYHYKGEPFHGVLKQRVTLDNGDETMHSIKELPNKLFEVDAIGTGFLLINMDVFKKLEPPFFYHAQPEEFGLKTVPFPNSDVGEDVYFCLKAKEAGFKIWADPNIDLGHIGPYEYTRKDFDEYELGREPKLSDLSDIDDFAKGR